MVSEALLVVLLGPTASGKTSLSLQIAERFGGEIVSCDSVAVYRGLEIGSAKPSIEERGRVPHHMIDIRDPDEFCTAGDYSREAREALAGITSRGRLPIVTGGTGLYLRALIYGLFEGPQRDEALRERLRSRSARPGLLHRVLRQLDPAAAKAIHANDTPKLIRAIEVCVAVRQPISQVWEQQGRDALQGYRILRIGLDPERKLLYDRINQRAAAMFDRGLLEETKAVAARYGAETRSLTSLGYAQALAVIRGEMSRDEAITAAQQGHRNYAKRQLTWFRREPEVHWIRAFGDDPATTAEAERLVKDGLR